MDDKVKTRLVSVRCIYWKWTPDDAGLCPIKLRITYRDTRKHYAVNHDGKKLFLSESAFNDVMDKKKIVKGANMAARKAIAAFEAQAESAIIRAQRGNRPFTWEKFEKEFLLNETSRGFLSMFSDNLEQIKSEGRIGTHDAYNSAYKAFKAFRHKKELSAYDLTPGLLKDFETFLEKRGCGKTTIGMYMRSLKVVFNLMADDDPALLENSPFAKRQNDRKRYKIRTGSGHKGEALTVEQLQKFKAIEIDVMQPWHIEAKLFFLFSFYCQGMNMRDVFLLKRSDIQGGVIKYVRAKTKDTEVVEATMDIPITKEIQSIIEQLGNPYKGPGEYLFKVIRDGMTVFKKYKKRVDAVRSDAEIINLIIKQKLKMINRRLKNICERDDVKLPVITSYWARHTYSNLLRESGVETELIRELLGHSDIRTTESYLKRFDLETKRKANEKINELLKVS